MKTEMNRAIETVNRHLNAAGVALVRWQEKFAADPANAFEWADPAFRAAATKQVAERCLALFARGASEKDVTADLEREVLSGARYPERSTSPSSNEFARALLQARAELLAELAFEA